MTGHQIRQAQLFNAISEAVLKTYGHVSLSAREEMTAHVVYQVTLEQAYHEHWVREQAVKAGYAVAEVVDMVASLHAPLGGVA